MSRCFPLLMIVVAALLTSMVCRAQDAQHQALVPLPPGINDVGVQAAPASTAGVPTDTGSTLRGLPDLPLAGDGGVPHDSPPRQSSPTVDVRMVGKDRVEEYRINGRLYMIHVIPAHGVPQTYMAGPGGVLERQTGQPPVKPVYYTIYQWGHSSKAKDGDDGN